ncbi:MAG: GTP-binding protein [Syntrophobacteraceae bacterium]|jgi:G3E family GTPase|nr:GTP-binding protein [Syntrophobacteraceae bacterium]
MELRTPIMLITGALGSGKTTLLRRILGGTRKRLAVLMNEFGEMAIDSRIIEGSSVRIVEISGGCVCCSLTGEFEAAVREILERARPDYILVEATGVAETDALVYEVEDSLPEVRLDSVVCVVDAYSSARHPYVGYAARAQLQSADIILVNKVDLVTTQEVRAVEDQVRGWNSTACFFKTVGCDVDLELLFGLGVDRRPLIQSCRGEPCFQSFTYVTEAPLDEKQFRQLLPSLPASVFRAKGFLCFEGDSYLFNYVVGRTDFEPFPADRTELVFIGRELDRDRDPILRQLRGCEVSHAF